MQGDVIQILVSFNQNYIPPFKVMFNSMILNNPQERFHIWLLHSGLTAEALDDLEAYCTARGAAFTPVEVDSTLFKGAPVSKQYPQEMYYRLLASHILPAEISRILYLDPDILVINPLRPLWETEMNGNVFAAAAHSCGPEMVNNVNRLRLDTAHDYYNTGVILMDLEKARLLVTAEEVFSYVQAHADELVLPDQDVFNALYGYCTLSVDDRLWNYDVRYFPEYYLKSEGVCSMEWLMENTAVLHFCGKSKPWRTGYTNRFASLYKHYAHLAKR